MLRLSQAVPYNVLCVDEDRYLTDLLHYALNHDGYNVMIANSGAEALRTAELDPPNLAVVDIHLSDMDSLTLCSRLRTTLQVPVIMLAADATDTDVLQAFDAGADECVSKPFNMQILSARIRAVLRRNTESNPLSGPMRIRYRLGSGTFHAEENQVSGPYGKIKLTAMQGKILRLLLENEGRVISAEHIMSKLWPFTTESEVSVVKSHISSLRKRIVAALGAETLIYTVAGVGYTVHSSSRAPDKQAI